MLDGRVVRKILHDRASYLEKGQETNPAAKKRRVRGMVQAPRKLGYAVAITPIREPTEGARCSAANRSLPRRFTFSGELGRFLVRRKIPPFATGQRGFC